MLKSLKLRRGMLALLAATLLTLALQSTVLPANAAGFDH